MIVGQTQIMAVIWMQGNYVLNFKIIFIHQIKYYFDRDDFLVNPLFVSGAIQKPQEPNIDFELDVKVFINSGKCVLHTKDSVKEDEIKL